MSSHVMENNTLNKYWIITNHAINNRLWRNKGTRVVYCLRPSVSKENAQRVVFVTIKSNEAIMLIID